MHGDNKIQIRRRASVIDRGKLAFYPSLRSTADHEDADCCIMQAIVGPRAKASIWPAAKILCDWFLPLFLQRVRLTGNSSTYLADLMGNSTLIPFPLLLTIC